jgi:hypothetical protein
MIPWPVYFPWPEPIHYFERLIILIGWGFFRPKTFTTQLMRPATFFIVAAIAAYLICRIISMPNHLNVDPRATPLYHSQNESVGL